MSIYGCAVPPRQRMNNHNENMVCLQQGVKGYRRLLPFKITTKRRLNYQTALFCFQALLSLRQLSLKISVVPGNVYPVYFVFFVEVKDEYVIAVELLSLVFNARKIFGLRAADHHLATD